jgi:hypothetical protein
MAGHYNQMRHGRGDARRKLDERLARKEVGDEAYDKAASYADNRAFTIFGIVFIVLFAVVVLGMAWLGY